MLPAELRGNLGEDALDSSLGLVEVARDGAHAQVLPRHGGHLGPLNGADALVGVEHHNRNAGHVRKAGERRGAGVAAGGGEDQDAVAAALLLHGAAHQLRQHRQRHVLERRRGAVEQLQHVLVPHLLQRGDLLYVKLVRIGALHAAVDLLLGVARQIRPQHAPGNLLEGRARQLLRRNLGKLLQCIQAAVRRDAAQHRLRAADAVFVAARAVKSTHNLYLFLKT